MSPLDADSPSPDTASGRTGPRSGRSRDIRIDLRLIADMVEPGSRVLDIGCGDGALLDYLTHGKGVDGRGIELSMEGVHRCVKQGLSVIQGDAETDLKDYPAGAFDYVILSQTLQAMRDPRAVLDHLVRIGRYAIVSFPNFGYWRIRLQLLLTGRMPVTERLGYQWWETPNIHFCTITDFVELCRDMGIRIERSMILNRVDRITGRGHGGLTNLMGEQGVFLLRRG
ncbi:methionine biosynthesis protein MetW [Azospirillum halopraeferens]|uniref:methionine biosynthesis protein MetW n=1 Tax=Azospirillum halopraeferens TaxID=34010 RepID=UPI000426922A|nr:methionine biosynthesis protein MetW [Azospirillum halopraeferens]